MAQISKLFENLSGLVLLGAVAAYFAFLLLSPIAAVTILLWEWDFIGEKRILLSEEFVAENRIFQKMTALSFMVDATTQSVVVKLESPTRSFFEKPYIHEKVEALNFSYVWSKLVKSKVSMGTITSKKLDSLIVGNPPVEYTNEEKKYLKKWELQSENLKILRDDFTPMSQLLVSLDNCTVESHEDWICQDQLPFLIGSHSYIGSFNNDWIIDYVPPDYKFSRYKFFNWKTDWWVANKRCSDVCFLETVENFNARTEAAKEFMRTRVIRRVDQ